jgi:uncharacterized membrane protein YidH (DUF202 family)
MGFHEDHALETYKSLMLYGSTGIKFVLGANGAAAIAVMTFLGHFVAAGNAEVPDLRTSLALFVVGVFVGGLSVASAYFTQLSLYNESVTSESAKVKPGHVFWLRVSIGLLLIGMILFAAGSLSAVCVLR